MFNRLWAIVGRRGTALLFFAFLDLVYCFSLFDPPQSAQRNRSLLFVGSIAPLWLWGLLWGVAGLVCLVNAFLRHDRWGFAAAMAIKTLWGCLFLYGAFIGLERAYLSATIWLCLAGWIAIISTWPEPPERVRGAP